MGASASINDELMRPLNASDVDTPRGESAKDEVRRLRALLAANYPPQQSPTDVQHDCEVNIMSQEYQDYLKSVFTAADINQNGFLSVNEFSVMLREQLELSLPEETLQHFEAQVGASPNNELTWEEFLALAPELFQYQGKSNNLSENNAQWVQSANSNTGGMDAHDHLQRSEGNQPFGEGDMHEVSHEHPGIETNEQLVLESHRSHNKPAVHKIEVSSLTRKMSGFFQKLVTSK